MSKRIFIFLLGAVFLFPLRFVHASLVINEVMYDLSGSDSTNSKSREWIEVYNPDASDFSIDASKWRIFDGGGNRTINDQVSFSIPAGAYVIWAGDKDTFLADHGGFNGVVYDTGITSLNNTGATLKILDQDGNPVDTVTYASMQGGAGDGNSLQKISGSWVGATPTPGAANENTGTNTNTNTTSSSSSDTIGGPLVTDYSVPDSTTSNTNTKESKTQTQEKKIQTNIVAKTSGFAKLPLSFSATSSGTSGEPMGYGKYFWNFGDGDFKQTRLNDSEKITHAYLYPGDYTVTLQYFMNPYAETPDASDEMTVKIVPLDITISNVGDDKDFFVELSNNTSYEMDISGWFLVSSTKSFLMPPNTIIGSKKKMVVSSKLTGFSVLDKDTLKLVTPQNVVAFDYSSSTSLVSKNVTEKPKQIVTVATKEPTIPKEIPQTETKNIVETAVEPIPPVLPTDLSASAISSGVTENNSSNSYLYIIVFIVLVIFGAGGVYFIRRKKVGAHIGDNFEILDE